MNFFSHYYIDKENPSPVFLFGTLLPELMPHFNQHIRKAVFNAPAEGQQINPVFQAIFKGIQRHYQVDKLFHNHPFFIQHTQYIKQQILQNPGLAVLHTKTYYLAHITLELMIDRVLIKTNAAEPDSFYKFLSTINTETIAQYFAFIGKSEQLPDFLKTYEAHNRIKFLYYYPNNEKFTEALLRLYSKINTNMPTLATHHAFTLVLKQVEAKLQQEMLIFVTEFKNQLNLQTA